MKKNTSWKFTDESSVTFQSSVSRAGEFGLRIIVPRSKDSLFFSNETVTIFAAATDNIVREFVVAVAHLSEMLSLS